LLNTKYRTKYVNTIQILIFTLVFKYFLRATASSGRYCWGAY